MGCCRTLRDNRRVVVRVGGPLLAAIIVAILVGESFDGLDAHEFGLLYYGNAVALDNERVFTNGRHFVGLGNSFVRFPRGQQYLEFSAAERPAAPPLDVWSSDGQVIFLEASLYFSLAPTHLHDIYYTYGDTAKCVACGGGAARRRWTGVGRGRRRRGAAGGR